MEEEIGRVSHYFSRIGVAVIEVTGSRLRVGDTVRIKGHTTDFTQAVDSLQQEHASVAEVGRGASAGLRVKYPVREHDLVFLIKSES